MTPFEYVTVLISIVIGLGLTQLLTGIAELIHHWQRIRLYWPHVIWVILAFFLHIQQWWELYALRDIVSWKLPVFFITILYPVNLFILSRILFPVIGDSHVVVDLKEFYYKHFRKFFVLIIILALTSAVDDIIINGFRFNDLAVELSLIVILGTIAVANIATEIVHKIVVTLLLVFVMLYLGTQWNNLSLNA